MPLKRRSTPSLVPQPGNAARGVSILDHVDEDVAPEDERAARRESHGAAISALAAHILTNPLGNDGWWKNHTK